MKRWLILFLLLPMTISANSWLDARADFYVAARVKLGYATANSAPLTDTTGSLLFNEAVTLILPINKGVKRVTKIVTAYHQTAYGLDSTLVDIESVFLDSSGFVKPMKYIPIGNWADQEHRGTDGGSSQNLTRTSYYDYTDSLIFIYPVPSQNRKDTLNIIGWHRIADVDIATVATQIPEMYRIAILYHMVWNHAKARYDKRTGVFKEELSLALGRVGLKLTPGGGVVKTTP